MTRSAAPPTARGAGPILKIGTADSSSMVDLQGKQSTGLQQYRELTMNALQGVANRTDGVGGNVVWDVDWGLVEASDGRQRKLAVTDTGCGMAAEELLLFINNLASSGQTRMGASDNHGIGAKIAAGYHNPRGLRYRSWRDGKGNQIVFRKHGGEWGLERQRPGEGDAAFVQPLSATDRPWLLEGDISGTIVTLFGHGDRDDTTASPKEMEFKGASWLRKYLNQRFFRLPFGAEVFVREGNQVKVGEWRPGQLERVLGQAVHLERRSIASGELELPAAGVADGGATVLWWILDGDVRGRRREAAYWRATGDVAALFQDELYDARPQTKGGYSRLQGEFGVRFGYERVVLYVVPRLARPRHARLIDAPAGSRSTIGLGCTPEASLVWDGGGTAGLVDPEDRR